MDPARGTLLLINPNTSAATTERLVNALAPLLPEGLDFQARTASLGARYIACEASHAVAGFAVLQAWAEARRDSTQRLAGVLIGCFGDPGLFALRECSAVPVTGLAEAAFLEAAGHGPFAVVTGGERWKPMLERLARALQVDGRLRAVHTVAPTGAQMLADPGMALAVLEAAAREVLRQHPGVRAVVIGGAGLAGYAARLQPGFDVPLIDSCEAGLRLLLAPDRLPSPERRSDGFHADWSAMPEAFGALDGPP